MKQSTIEIIVVLVCATILLSVPIIEFAKCGARADRMGINKEYGIIAGCIIEHQPGKWVPLDMYRALDD